MTRRCKQKLHFLCGEKCIQLPSGMTGFLFHRMFCSSGKCFLPSLFCIAFRFQSRAKAIDKKRKTRIKTGTNRSIYRPKLISTPPFSSDVIDPFRLHSGATAMWRQRDDSKKKTWPPSLLTLLLLHCYCTSPPKGTQKTRDLVNGTEQNQHFFSLCSTPAALELTGGLIGIVYLNQRAD